MDTIFLYALNVASLDADSAVWAAFVSADRRARMAALKNHRRPPPLLGGGTGAARGALAAHGRLRSAARL